MTWLSIGYYLYVLLKGAALTKILDKKGWNGRP